MDYTIQNGKTITVRTIKKVRQVYVENIVYITCDTYLLSIFLVNQREPEVMSKSLKLMEEELSDFCFFKINRSQLINLRHLKFCCNNSRTISMFDGTTLSVSRRKLVEIKNTL